MNPNLLHLGVSLQGFVFMNYKNDPLTIFQIFEDSGTNTEKF